MKHFKKAASILLFAVFALSISMPALAQDGGSGTRRGGGQDIVVFDIVDSW